MRWDELGEASSAQQTEHRRFLPRSRCPYYLPYTKQPRRDNRGGVISALILDSYWALWVNRSEEEVRRRNANYMCLV